MPVITGNIEGENLNQRRLFSRFDGSDIYEMEHLIQGIGMVLTTPLNTRIMRPWFGSNLHLWMDRPDTPTTRLNIFYETAVALNRNIRRLKINRVKIADIDTSTKHLVLDLYGYHKIDGEAFSLRGLSLDFLSENRYSLIV